MKWRGKKHGANCCPQNAMIRTAFLSRPRNRLIQLAVVHLALQEPYLCEHKTAKTRCHKKKGSILSILATFCFYQTKKVIGMPQQCLYRRIVEHFGVPVVCVDARLRDRRRKHVAVAQPVHLRPVLVEYPCSGRLGVEAVDRNDADTISAVLCRVETTNSSVVVSVVPSAGTSLWRPSRRSVGGAATVCQYWH